MNDSTIELQALRTVRDLVRWGASEFSRAALVFGHGTENALDEAFHLVLWRLNLPFDLPAIYLESNVTEAERRAVVELLRARVLTRKPAPYLTGEAWFAGLAFHVDERVLIPRSPIGEMIVEEFQPWLTVPPRRILDLCAGSGCIGIACALAFPDAQVELAELDDHAIQVAARNMRRHHVEDRVSISAGDLFKPLKGRRYDLIVTNPPYVSLGEWATLAPEYKHEPRRALEAGADGMDIVARILTEAPAHLEDGGSLVCEIGGSRAEFEHRCAGFAGTWPEFAQGGDGVFVVAKQELQHWLEARGGVRKKGKN